ncbi:MAG: RAMP superfamily CRISPR-associated protein [Candidatus Bathyarchaeia archaeon]
MLHMELKRRLLIECKIKCREDLHVGMGRPETSVAAVDLPFQRDAMGGPFIPGSCLRGAFRAHVHRLLTSIKAMGGPEAAEILEGESVAADDEKEREFAQASGDEKDQLFGELGVIDKLFGLSGFASPLRFTDAHPVGSVEPYRRVHVAIDIGTDRAKERALLDLEAVPAGSEFTFRIIFDELSDKRMRVANKMFYRFLKTLAKDGVEMFLGGWRSRGYGLSEVKAIKLEEYSPSMLILGEPPRTYEKEKVASFADRILEELGEAE